jgi:hypothetical protein
VRDTLSDNLLYLTESGGSIINNPVGTMAVSSPTYTQTGTLAQLQATTTTISGTTTNLNSTTTSSTSTTVNATSATGVNLGSSSSLVTIGNLLKMTNGFFFGTGNLTTTSGYFIQTGRSGTRGSLAANSGTELAITFTTAFSAGTPFVIAIANVLASPTSCRVATCVSVTTNLGFNANMYNPTGSASGNYEVTYIAIGRV